MRALAAPYPPELRRRVLALARDRAEVSLDEIGSLDTELGHAFADAALTLLKQAQVEPSQIRALGSHGQTVRHRPFDAAPYTLQIGDPNVIAERTGITTVGDFRRRDLAAGGQAAPLLPGFHAVIFAQPARTRVALNLGGIANITILPGAPAAPCSATTPVRPIACSMHGRSVIAAPHATKAVPGRAAVRQTLHCSRICSTSRISHSADPRAAAARCSTSTGSNASLGHRAHRSTSRRRCWI